MKRLIPLVETTVVLALFLTLLFALRGMPFGDWQKAAFGSAPITSTLLFFVLPLAFLIAGRRNLGRYGLATSELRYHLQVGLRAAGVLLPAALLFPLIGLLGTTHEEWPGALILTLGITLSGVLAVKRTAALKTLSSQAISSSGVGGYFAILVLGLFICLVLNMISGVLARAVYLLIFVGFLEEFFFRGYVQSRLNDAFGRPFRLAGVKLGAGLFLSAAFFGLLHPLTSTTGMPWPWALWTFAGGLLFGYLREKSGSVIASSVAHGLFVLPTAFFAP